MHTHSHSRGPATTSPVLSLLLATTVVLAATLAAWDAAWAATESGVDQSRAAAELAATGDGAWFEHEAPEPVRVRSEAVDITSETIPLGKTDDDRLEVPEDAHTAGWWTGRANPGERGPAVIVGHVDSRQGPGAFWELPDLEPGDRVTVDRADGTSVHWRVDRLEAHPKDDFPTGAVYGETAAPTLRLITCSGFFDPDARSYEANTIVFLTLDEEQDHVPARTSGPEPDTDSDTDSGTAPDRVDLQTAEDAPVGEPSPSASGSDPRPRPVGEQHRELSAPAAATHALSRDVGGDRSVPIALATLSLLGASGAVWREWARRR